MDAHRCAADGSTSQNTETRTYLSRFWVLGLLALLSLLQSLQFMMWGPLSESVAAAYPGWGSSTVAMMANWGTITYSVFVALTCWLMDAKGLRAGIALAAVLIAFSAVVKIISFPTDSDVFFTVTCHIGAMTNGVAGTIVYSAPPMLAALWFPPKERTTTIAAAQMAVQLGVTGSYLEPLVVRSPGDDATSGQMKDDIRRLLFIWVPGVNFLLHADAGVAVALLVTVLVYFPARPPSPPSITSYVKRKDFKSSLKMMIRKRDFMLVLLSYTLCVSIPSFWVSVLNYSLADLGMTQDEAMWVGLTAMLVQIPVGLLVGRFTDLVYGHIRLSLLVFMSASLACFYWFFLLTWGTIPVTTWQIFFSVVGGLTLSLSTVPMFFEVAVELAYPSQEVVVAGLLTGCFNFLGLCFLFLYLIPNIGFYWVTYMLLGTSSCALLLIVMVREDYSRSSIDRHQTQQQQLAQPPDTGGEDNASFQPSQC